MDPSFERQGEDLVDGEAVSMSIEHLADSLSIFSHVQLVKADSSIGSKKARR